jgi:hypothetical protein
MKKISNALNANKPNLMMQQISLANRRLPRKILLDVMPLDKKHFLLNMRGFSSAMNFSSGNDKITRKYNRILTQNWYGTVC